MNKVLFKSACIEWQTPQSVYDSLDAEFHFTLDPCATNDNAKANQGFTSVFDGLGCAWHGVVFVNPPYGRQISKWVEKAYLEHLAGTTLVMLLPSRTDTKWWHDYCMKADEIRFIRGRLKFGSAIHNAPFPSAIVIFRGKR